MVRVGIGSKEHWKKRIVTLRANQKELIKRSLDLAYVEFLKTHGYKPDLYDLKQGFFKKFGKSMKRFPYFNIFELMILDTGAGFGYKMNTENFEVTKVE